MKINIGKTELIHFVGIGGIGMSGLALIMNELGFKVQGSDLSYNKNIERLKENKFKIKIYKTMKFSKDETIDSITLGLNKVLEEMIVKNPDQWIWSHNRWK